MAMSKEMPVAEKGARAQKYLDAARNLFAQFVFAHLGGLAVRELEKRWDGEMISVPDDASDEERYEAAYGNWIRMANIGHAFVKERLGNDGLKALEEARVVALKADSAGPQTTLLKVIRTVAPRSAFTMAARQLAYEFQWLTPTALDALSDEEATLTMAQCKVLDHPGTEYLCRVFCQSTHRIWAGDELKVGMRFEPSGQGCTCTLTPLK